MKLLNLILLTLILIPAAASDSAAQKTKSSDKPKPLMPLAVGNIWKMRESMSMPTADRDDSRNTEREITETKMEEGRAWFRIQGRDEIGDGLSMLAINDSTGLTTKFDSDIGIHYPYPAKIGESSEAPGGGRVTVVAVDSSITVPAGTFRCYVYTISSGGSTQTTAYAPGVGMILTVAELGVMTVRSELVSYTVR